MEKNRIRPASGTRVARMSFARQKEVLDMPNLVEVQKNSYQWFLEEGLQEVFDDISPISDYSDSLSLEFVSYELREEEKKYTIEECKERDTTYAAPLFVKVRLRNKEDIKNIQEHDIFMGDLPLMTETGTFVINGAERVIVSQLVRSPGIYYALGHDKLGKEDSRLKRLAEADGISYEDARPGIAGRVERMFGRLQLVVHHVHRRVMGDGDRIGRNRILA